MALFLSKLTSNGALPLSYSDEELRLPETDRLVERLLQFSTGTAVNPEEIGVIGQIVRLAVANAEEIRVRLCSISSSASA